MPSQGPRTIKSAHRVLEILEFFDQDRRQATVMDMSRALSYPQSSTSELLRCLTRLGYLHYNRFRRTYSPTARVALLGAWVEPSFFRGGPVLTAADEVAKQIGETVILSTATNYQVQHLHVIHGAGANAVDAHVGHTESLLHTHWGLLLLSSYADKHVKSAIHRLNAEEQDPTRRVRLTDTVDQVLALRDKCWAVQHDENGIGSIAALLLPRRGMDRLVLSVVARSHVIETRWEEIVKVVLDQRQAIAACSSDVEPDGSGAKIISFQDADHDRQIAYRREAVV